jgi:uridine kinase
MDDKTNYPRIIGISCKTGAGKSTIYKLLANELKATLISWDDYDDISQEPDDFIAWSHHGQDYDAFKRQALSKNLEELKNNKVTLHPVSNQILPATAFIIFDAPLGRLHQETGKFIDIMIHLDVPLDVLLCRRLLRDFKEQNNTKDLLEEMLFYLEHSRPLYLGKELKDTADLVVDGMLSPEQELTDVINYIKNQDESIVYECRK